MGKTVDAVGHSISLDSQALPDAQLKAYFEFKRTQKDDATRAVTAYVKKNNLNVGDAKELLLSLGLLDEDN